MRQERPTSGQRAHTIVLESKPWSPNLGSRLPNLGTHLPITSTKLPYFGSGSSYLYLQSPIVKSLINPKCLHNPYNKKIFIFPENSIINNTSDVEPVMAKPNFKFIEYLENNPWMNEELVELMKQKQNAYRKWKRNKDASQDEYLKQVSRSLTNLYNTKKNRSKRRLILLEMEKR